MIFAKRKIARKSIISRGLFICNTLIIRQRAKENEWVAGKISYFT